MKTKKIAKKYYCLLTLPKSLHLDVPVHKTLLLISNVQFWRWANFPLCHVFSTPVALCCLLTKTKKITCT